MLFLGAVMAAIIFGSASPPARAAEILGGQNADVSLNSQTGGDAFVAGNSAAVNVPVGGELFIAGNTVSVNESGGRSIAAAGNSVTVSKGTAYNAYVAGNTVVLSGTYGHDVYVAGNSVTITDGTVINGELRVAASHLSLSGRVGGNAFLAVSSLASKADIGGSVKAWGDSLAFTGGSIAGDFSYQSKKDAAGLDMVKISGKTIKTAPPEGRAQRKWSPATLWLWAFLWKLIGTMVLGAVLLLVARERFVGLYGEMRERWPASFGWGLGVLVLTPILAVVVLALIVGYQVAIALALTYAVLLLLANAFASIFVGRFLFERVGGRAGSFWQSLLVGVVVVAFLTSLPYVGWILGAVYFFGAVVPALGAMSRRLLAL